MLRAVWLSAVCALAVLPLRGYRFNYLMFGPIWAVPRIMAGLGIRLGSVVQVNTLALNAPLPALFSLDVRSAPRQRPPFGVSIPCLAEAGERAAHG